MWNILPDQPYNPNVTYYNCSSSAEIPESQQTEIRIYTLNGFPFIKYTYPIPYWWQDNTYVWGNTPGSGSYGFQKRCFNPNKFYTATIVGNQRSNDNLNQYSNISVYLPYGAGSATYSGNYLNWYYGSDPAIFGANAIRKPNTKSRYQVMQEVTNELLDHLSSKNVKVGLGKFHDDYNGSILVGVSNINNNLNQLKSAVNGMNYSGGTPLAQTLHQLGRYFVQGYNNTLTLYPEQSKQMQKSAYMVFNHEPRMTSEVNFRSPIEYFCQKNFIVMLTDGVQDPADPNISRSTGLTDYASDGNPNNIFLDDVAAAMYDIDLRPDLVDQDNQAVKNNISTYTIGFALSGDDEQSSSSLLVETAAKGGGLFYSALNQSELQKAFEQIAGDIQTRSASASSLAFTSGNISSDFGVFISTYISGEWIGDLKRLAINQAGDVGILSWNAGTLLDARDPSSRFMFTYNDQLNEPVLFRNIADLSTRQKSDLNLGPAGYSDNKGQQRINYFRGDQSMEGTQFRQRNSILGDIVNSSPVYVGVPESDWPDLAPFPTGSNKYSSFKASHISRIPFVYVGTNAGILHGFNATNGQEGMAYVPNQLFSTNLDRGLHYLTWLSYTHRFYTDLTPQVQDAYVPVEPGGNKAWRTLLMGGLGGGGKGYFLLNVTDPKQFRDSFLTRLFVWEFTSTHDADLGYAYSEPIIGLLNNGRWAAIFGNGYNNNGSGRAKLFIVFLDGGLNGSWVEGSDYIKIDTKRGNLSNANGLSTPAAVDLNNNRTIDRVYAGDVTGNMWAFDLSSNNPTGWKVAYGTSSKPRPLFRRSNRPITAAPVVVKNPIISTSSMNTPNLLVLYGTGQYLTASDPITTNSQEFYGIWDSGKGNLRINDLQHQPYVINHSSHRVMNSLSVKYSHSKTPQYGWYIDLDPGERVITVPVVKNNIVFFSTLIPDASSPCSFGGTGYLMAVNVENGGEPDFVVMDVDQDKSVDLQDQLNGKVVSGIKFSNGVPLQPSIRGDSVYTPKSDGEISAIKIFTNQSLEGRISWEDLRLSK